MLLFGIVCKQPFHYSVKTNFTTISDGHSVKSAFVDSTVTALRRPSSSGFVFCGGVFKLVIPSLQF